MVEALSSRGTLSLEKKWLTYDSKSAAFAFFVSKVSTVLDNMDKTGCKSNETKKKQKFKKKNDKQRKDKCKFKAFNVCEPRTKVVDEKNHYCDKRRGPEGKPMRSMCKSSEYKNFIKPQPKTTDVCLETTDELRLLLTIFKKDF